MKEPKNENDMVGKIIAYESGEMSEDQTIEFFQELYNSGLWQSLQGHYHRVMNSLIEEGFVKI